MDGGGVLRAARRRARPRFPTCPPRSSRVISLASNHRISEYLGFWRILRTGALCEAKHAVVVEFIKHRGQAYGEHLPADVAQELGHEDPADAGKAGVLVGEARAAGMGLEPVGDLRHVAAFVADPRPAQQRRLVHLKHLAVDDAAPAGLRLRDEAELRAYDGGEAFRPPAGAGRGPQRDERRVGHGPPDFRDGMGVVTHDADVSHGSSFGCEVDYEHHFYSCYKVIVAEII